MFWTFLQHKQGSAWFEWSAQYFWTRLYMWKSQHSFKKSVRYCIAIQISLIRNCIVMNLLNCRLNDLNVYVQNLHGIAVQDFLSIDLVLPKLIWNLLYVCMIVLSFHVIVFFIFKYYNIYCFSLETEWRLKYFFLTFFRIFAASKFDWFPVFHKFVG